MNPPLKVVAIVGPTASGKSALAVFLAKKFNGVVISADSRQVYKKLDELTGKISKQEMQKIAHYLIDIINIEDYFSVAQYQKLAYEILWEIDKGNQTSAKPILPIVAGGTGLYVSAVCDGYEFVDTKPDPALRVKLEKMTLSELQAKWLGMSSNTNVDLKNPRRLIRAIEVKTNGSGANPSKNSRFDVLKIGIKKTPEQIKQAIRKRVKGLDLNQLIKETRLLTKSPKSNDNPLSTYYAPVKAFIDKEISEPEMRAAMVFADTHYSKRQMTWFKKDKSIVWITSLMAAEKLVDKWLNS